MTHCPVCEKLMFECECDEIPCEHDWRKDGFGSYFCTDCGEENGPDGDGPDD